MSLKQLGLTGKIKELVGDVDTPDYEMARVIAEHKERYTIQTAENTLTAEITGNLRYSAVEKADFPAVGDWVKVMSLDERTAIIMEIFPRTSVLSRQAVNKFGELQVIATNIDYAFIVQAVGHDFNLNRLERYLAICHAAQINPIVLLTKTDLVVEQETNKLLHQIKNRTNEIPVVPLSVVTDPTLAALKPLLNPYGTYCFIGSSGVGKSSIINALKGDEYFKTQSVSTSTSKGKHTTTHRELMILPNGSIVIDTPGMREVGVVQNIQGIELTYDKITELAQQCRFNDCTHQVEKGCAILAALEDGELSSDLYENYQKLKREQEHFSSTVKEKREKDRSMGKLYKSIIKAKQERKY